MDDSDFYDDRFDDLKEQAIADKRTRNEQDQWINELWHDYNRSR